MSNGLDKAWAATTESEGWGSSRSEAKGQSLEQGFQVELVRAKAIARGYGSIVAEDEQGYSNGLVELQKITQGEAFNHLTRVRWSRYYI